MTERDPAVVAERVERISALLASGLSCGQIARQLAVSKGSVMGLKHRWIDTGRRPEPKLGPVPVPVAEPRGCQFPLSDGRPWRFCDAPATKGVWCAEHYRICYSGRGGWG
jgi:hypothetical protein